MLAKNPLYMSFVHQYCAQPLYINHRVPSVKVLFISSRFGPLVRHWTMRFEAKHSYFKQLAQAVGYFINLPYSLAMRHQQLRSACYQANSVTGIPGDGLIIGPGINAINVMHHTRLNEDGHCLS